MGEPGLKDVKERKVSGAMIEELLTWRAACGMGSPSPGRSINSGFFKTFASVKAGWGAIEGDEIRVVGLTTSRCQGLVDENSLSRRAESETGWTSFAER